jgi:ABC-type lipoprotein release transport system permease subunit
VAERIEGKVFLSYKEKSAGAVLIGIEPSKEVMVTNLWKAVKAGRYLQATDASAMVLGEAMRKRLGVNLGDEIAVITQAADGSMGAAKYKVVGIYDTGTNSFEWGYVFIPLPAARDLFALWGRSNEIVIKVKNRSSAPGIKIALAKVLTPHKIAVLDWWQLVPELIGGYNLRRAVLYLVLLTVFLIVANGITNTILMSVAERTREFGVLMALGTSGGQIVILVVLEAFFVGLAGILSGGILGLAVISVINLTGINFTSYAEYLASGGGPAFPLVIYPVFTLRRFYLLSGMVLLVSVLAAIYPAVKAARLKPARAISQMETI